MTRESVSRIARWIPALVLVIAAVALLGMFAAGGMTRISAWYLFQLVLPLLGLFFLVTGLAYALVRRRLRSRALLTTLLLSFLSLLPAIMLVVPVTYPASLDSMEPAATVRLPADVPLKVAWGGDSVATNQHAAVPDQRWAYDLVVEPYFTGSAEVTDYGCYGVTVVAPAAGDVTAAHDGEPDMTPGLTASNFEAPLGNHVITRLESGTYLVIAHLKPGSLLVSAGERVAEGQPLGECGNSGNTSEPHIHIHHQRQDPSEFPLNFAEGLPLYFRDHDGPPMPTGGLRLEGDTLVATGDTVRHLGD